jgi:hypothetical protein
MSEYEFGASDWTESHFGGSDWTDSHFGGSDWTASHFGCLFGEDVGCEDDPSLTAGPVEFGIDPITLLPAVMVAGGTIAYAYRGRIFGHRRRHGRGGGGVSVEAAPSNMTDSDNEFEALQYAAQTDPYALGQPL